jgi:hypothetical protein
MLVCKLVIGQINKNIKDMMNGERRRQEKKTNENCMCHSPDTGERTTTFTTTMIEETIVINQNLFLYMLSTSHWRSTMAEHVQHLRCVQKCK